MDISLGISRAVSQDPLESCRHRKPLRPLFLLHQRDSPPRQRNGFGASNNEGQALRKREDGWSKHVSLGTSRCSYVRGSQDAVGRALSFPAEHHAGTIGNRNHWVTFGLLPRLAYHRLIQSKSCRREK